MEITGVSKPKHSWVSRAQSTGHHFHRREWSGPASGYPFPITPFRWNTLQQKCVVTKLIKNMDADLNRMKNKNLEYTKINEGRKPRPDQEPARGQVMGCLFSVTLLAAIEVARLNIKN